MSNSPTRPSKSFKDYLPTGRSIFHPLIGELSVVKSSSSGQSLIKKAVDTPRLQDPAKKSQLHSHIVLSHPKLLKFEGYEPITNNQNHIYSESFEMTLKDEIQLRSQNNSRFTEQEITELIRSSTSALAYMHGNNVAHGQVRADTLIKVGTEYKLLDPIIFGVFPQSSLGSPSEWLKEDVYALGQITLDAMTLSVTSRESISERFAIASQFYSNKLIGIINKMTESIVSLRVDALSCNSLLDGTYSQKDALPQRNGIYQRGDTIYQGFYAGNNSVESSLLRSPYINEDSQHHSKTGVSLNDIKRYSPTYRRREGTLQEQRFSPTRHGGRDKEEERLVESYTQTDYRPETNYRSEINYSPFLQKQRNITNTKEVESSLSKSYVEDRYYESSRSSAQHSRLPQFNWSPSRTNKYQSVWESTSSLVSEGPYRYHLYNPGSYHHQQDYDTDWRKYSERSYDTRNERLHSPTGRDISYHSPSKSTYISETRQINTKDYHREEGNRNYARERSYEKPQERSYGKTYEKHEKSYERPLEVQESFDQKSHERSKSSVALATPERMNYKLYKLVEEGNANKIYENAPNQDPVPEKKTDMISHTSVVSQQNQPSYIELYPNEKESYVISNVRANEYIPESYTYSQIQEVNYQPIITEQASYIHAYPTVAQESYLVSNVAVPSTQVYVTEQVPVYTTPLYTNYVTAQEEAYVLPQTSYIAQPIQTTYAPIYQEPSYALSSYTNAPTTQVKTMYLTDSVPISSNTAGIYEGYSQFQTDYTFPISTGYNQMQGNYTTQTAAPVSTEYTQTQGGYAPVPSGYSQAHGDHTSHTFADHAQTDDDQKTIIKDIGEKMVVTAIENQI